MSFDARAIANFFLDRADATAVPVTAMALLKIIYFSHAWHLVKYRKPLVGQAFEAWQYGPVVRVVYDQIRSMGSSPIRARLTKLDVSTGELAPAAADIDDETRQFLQNMFDYYARFSGLKLSDLTHIEGSPWDSVWAEAERRAVPGMLISDERIAEWFERTGGALGRTKGTSNA